MVTGNTDGYTTPADENSNTVFDFREVGLMPNITTEPLDQNIFVAENTAFSISAANVDTYQWQILVGAIWTNLTNTGIHSGTSTATLIITNVAQTDNGNRYRAIASNTVYACSAETSDEVTLTVKVKTVITNCRITYRVKKN